MILGDAFKLSDDSSRPYDENEPLTQSGRPEGEDVY